MPESKKKYMKDLDGIGYYESYGNQNIMGVATSKIINLESNHREVHVAITKVLNLYNNNTVKRLLSNEEDFDEEIQLFFSDMYLYIAERVQIEEKENDFIACSFFGAVMHKINNAEKNNTNPYEKKILREFKEKLIDTRNIIRKKALNEIKLKKKNL